MFCPIFVCTEYENLIIFGISALWTVRFVIFRRNFVHSVWCTLDLTIYFISKSTAQSSIVLDSSLVLTVMLFR